MTASDLSHQPPTFGGISSAADLDNCLDTGVFITWDAAVGFGDGTNFYRVYRSPYLDCSMDVLIADLADTETSQLAFIRIDFEYHILIQYHFLRYRHMNIVNGHGPLLYDIVLLFVGIAVMTVNGSPFMCLLKYDT